MKKYLTTIIIFSILLFTFSFFDSHAFAKDKESYDKNYKFRINNNLNTSPDHIRKVMADNQSDNSFGVSLTKEEANQVKNLDDLGSEISRTIKNVVGEEMYGGIYINHASDKIHIGLVNNHYNNNIINAIKKEYKSENLVFFKTKFSEDDLKKAKDDLNHYIQINHIDVDYSYLSIQNNRVVVGVKKNDSKTINTLKKIFPKDVYHFEFSKVTKITTEAYREINEYRTPYVAGQEINSNRGVCTSAFMYKIGNSAFQVTAGHCFNYGEDVYIGSTKMGRVSTVKFGPVADVEAIAIPQEYSRSYLYGTTNDIQNYFGNAEYLSGEVIGETVCKYGRTTFKTCGKLTNKDYDAYHPDRVIYNTRLATYYSDQGDSGSPVFNVIDSENRRLLGVHSGSVMFADGTRYAVYSHISNVAKALNFTYSDIELGN